MTVATIGIQNLPTIFAQELVFIELDVNAIVDHHLSFTTFRTILVPPFVADLREHDSQTNGCHQSHNPKDDGKYSMWNTHARHQTVHNAIGGDEQSQQCGYQEDEEERHVFFENLRGVPIEEVRCLVGHIDGQY